MGFEGIPFFSTSTSLFSASPLRSPSIASLCSSNFKNSGLFWGVPKIIGAFRCISSASANCSGVNKGGDGFRARGNDCGPSSHLATCELELWNPFSLSAEPRSLRVLGVTVRNMFPLGGWNDTPCGLWLMQMQLDILDTPRSSHPLPISCLSRSGNVPVDFSALAPRKRKHRWQWAHICVAREWHLKEIWV